MPAIGKPFTKAELKVISEMYGHTFTGTIAFILDRNFMEVHNKALELQLEKQGIFKKCTDNLRLNNK